MPLWISLLVVGLSASQAPAPQSKTQPPAPIHVLRIVAGPSGYEEKGSFVLKEERSVFNRSDDREVIILFQWEGAPGPHKLSAQWRSPDGGQSSISIIEYVAKERKFGAYWTLPLSPAIQVGHWSIEATVDGQPAGRFSFEVTDTKVVSALVKRPLSQAQLYERLTKMFVSLQRSNAAGRELDPAAALIGPGGHVYTSMAAIDDTDRVLAHGPNGLVRDMTAIIAWNRRQDWAVLPGVGGPALDVPVVEAGATSVGDRCFSMEGGATGGRVLLECSITGKGAAVLGPRLLASFFTGTGHPGAPVLNEFGELIGFVGATHVSGTSRLIHILRFRGYLSGVPIVPLAAIQAPLTAPPAAMAELRARGDLIPALAEEEHVLSGGFARDIMRRETVAPSEQRDDFSAKEKRFFVFVTWDPKERLRGTTGLRIYDGDNRIILEAKPLKADFRKGELRFTSWEISMLPVPGVYRVEVHFNGRPAWRGFVRITP